MGERPDQERIPDYAAYSSGLERAILEPDGSIDFKTKWGRLGGRWRGTISAIALLTAVAIASLSFVEYAFITIPIVLGMAMAVIVVLRRHEHNTHDPPKGGRRGADPPQLGRKRPREGPD